MTQTTRKSGQKKIFRIVLLAIAGLNLCAIALILLWLWNRLETYEKNSPEPAMRAYFEQMHGGGLEDAAAQIHPGGLNTLKDTADWLRQTFTGDPAAYRYVQLSKTQEGLRYAVYDGSHRLGYVRLQSANGENGPWSARAEVTLLEPYTVRAPAFVQVSLNGRPLPDACRTEKSEPVEAFAALRNKEAIPQMVEYTVSGLLLEPAFTASTPDGRAAAVSFDAQARLAAVTVPAEGTVKKEFEQLLETAAKTYARYISQDAEWAELMACVYKNSDFYDAVRNYDGKWYNKHIGYAFENFSITGVESYAADSFAGDVSFDYVVKRTHDTHTYPTRYRLAFQKIDGRYQLVNLLFL